MSNEPSGADAEDIEPEVDESNEISEMDEEADVEEAVETNARPVRFAFDISGMVNMPNFKILDTDTFFQVMRAAGISDPAAKIIPALDLGPQPDLSKFDFSNFVPKIDVLGSFTESVSRANANISERMAKLSESMSLAVPKVNFQDLLPGIAFPALNIAEQYAGLYASISDIFEPMMRRLQERLPPNWPEGGDMLDRGLDIIRDEGVPLVWVPRKEIIVELLDAPDRDSRLGILVARKFEIAEDCREVLAEMRSGSFAGQVALLLRAVDALASDHNEAAQALAVVVTETAVSRSIGDYAEVKKKVIVDLTKGSFVLTSFACSLTSTWIFLHGLVCKLGHAAAGTS